MYLSNGINKSIGNFRETIPILVRASVNYIYILAASN
jgi:hypothetical protein